MFKDLAGRAVSMSKRRKVAAVGIALGLSATTLGAAYGGSQLAPKFSFDGGKVTACVNTATGAMRVIESGQSCAINGTPGNRGLREVKLTWNTKGPRGATGATGATGDAGSNGAVGAVGATGATGDKGAAGSTGAKGENGANGAKGETGAKGDTGADGAKGDKGDTGIDGAKGESGVKGDNGIDGAKGEKGDPGTAGTAGAKGEKGDQGIQGIQGIVGPAGEAGPAGPAGPAGAGGSSSYATVTAVRSGVFANNATELSANCTGATPNVISGGYTWTQDSNGAAPYQMSVFSNGPVGSSSWRVSGLAYPSSGNTVTLTVYARCAS